MWGATTLKLKKKSIKFLKNRCQSPGVKYNGGGGRLQQRPLKFNNIMNIINIINILLISRDWASIGKIITGTENTGVNRHALAEKLVIGGDAALALPIETCFVEAPAGASRKFAEVGRTRTTSIAKRSKITYLIATFLAKVCLSKQKFEKPG